MMQCANVMAGLMGGTVDYRFLPRGGGGIKHNFTGTELAGYLSGLSSVETDLAYAIYTQDEDALFMLRLHMQLYAASMAVAEQWSSYSADNVKRLGTLAVFELSSNDICQLCLGSGVYRAQTCSFCDGAGHLPSSGRQRASFVLVNQSAWQRFWADRYERVLGYLVNLDNKVNSVIMKNSRDVF